MKKILVSILAVGMWTSAQAAYVSIDTPVIGGASSYMFGSQAHEVFENVVNDQPFPSEAYDDRRSDLSLVNVANNNEEELIYLGAYKNSSFTSSGGVNNEIAVTVNNLNASGGLNPLTGGVSLVLSGAESLSWDMTIDEGVQVNSIFLFGLAGQTLTINGDVVNLSSNDEFFGSISIETSPVPVCGYALPSDGQGCNTDRILGVNQQSTDMFGFTTNTNGAGLNYLGDLTDLNITSFSGSYIVDGFDIGIDSVAAVVPLPGALVLFSSALAVLIVRRGSLQKYS